MVSYKFRPIHLFYALIGIVVLLYCLKEARDPNDFNVYLSAADQLKSAQSPYDEWFFVSEGNYCLYFYSPLWALILIPFTYLPATLVNFIWLLANIFFLIRIFKLLSFYLPKNSLTKNQTQLLIFLALISNIRFVLYNFEMVQMTIFLLWGSLVSLKLMNEDKNFLGGGLLALIINIKILPLVFLPYLLYRGYFKGFGFSLLFILIYFLFPALFLGLDFNLTLHQDWWSAINPSNSEHIFETDLGPHSLTALIPTLLTETLSEVKSTRHISNLSPADVTMVLNLVRLFLIAFTLYFLRMPTLKPPKSTIYTLRNLSYLFLLIPLIFPHQQKYAFVLTLPVFYYLIYFVLSQPNIHNVKKKLIIILTVLAFILMTLTTDGLIGKSLNILTQHYKTITWGTLLLIIPLVLAKSSKKV